MHYLPTNQICLLISGKNGNIARLLLLAASVATTATNHEKIGTRQRRLIIGNVPGNISGKNGNNSGNEIGNIRTPTLPPITATITPRKNSIPWRCRLCYTFRANNISLAHEPSGWFAPACARVRASIDLAVDRGSK